MLIQAEFSFFLFNEFTVLKKSIPLTESIWNPLLWFVLQISKTVAIAYEMDKYELWYIIFQHLFYNVPFFLKKQKVLMEAR